MTISIVGYVKVYPEELSKLAPSSNPIPGKSRCKKKVIFGSNQTSSPLTKSTNAPIAKILGKSKALRKLTPLSNGK